MARRRALTAPPHAALEAEVEAAPDDPERYWVYGDWLEAQGDPRGRCIAAARALQRVPPEDRRQTALAKKGLAQAMAALRASLGPVGRFHDRLVSEHVVRFRFGLIERATIRRRSKKSTLVRELEMLLSHPSARFLRHLSMSFPDLGSDRPGYGAALERLAELAPHTLWSLELGAGGVGPGELGDTLARLPQIASLSIAGDDVRLEPSSTRCLVSLSIGRIATRDPWLLEHASFDALERLELVYFNAAADVPKLVLPSHRFPRLGKLLVQLHRGWPPDSLARLFDPSLIRRLHQLDLGVPWFDDSQAAWLIDHADMFRHLARLRVDTNKPSRASELAERIPGFELGVVVPRDPFHDGQERP